MRQATAAGQNVDLLLSACCVQIAQLLTVKRERELENKVSKRASRSLQRFVL